MVIKQNFPSDKKISLKQYAKYRKKDQKYVFFIISKSFETVNSHSIVEKFDNLRCQVLYMTTIAKYAVFAILKNLMAKKTLFNKK